MLLLSASSSQLQLRDAPPPRHAEPLNTIAESARHIITFKHPGYPDLAGQNDLLVLYAIDHPNGGGYIMGPPSMPAQSWQATLGMATSQRPGMAHT
jgi:hypothetical protein